MAIHSFCHLEEPVPQNNDLKKAHLFARKYLHLGISTDAAQGYFFKPRLFQQNCYFPNTTSGTKIKLDKRAVLYLKSKKVWVACQKSLPKLECKGSKVLMMNKNGYLEDNNGYGIFKSVAFWS